MKPDPTSRSGVLRSAAIVGAGTALSRVLGFVREMLMAYYFGMTLAKSAFDVAFRIPNLFRRLFGEGALSAAFVPVFSETLEHEGLKSANRLVGRVGTLLAVTLAMIVGGGLLIITLWLKSPAGGEKTLAVLSLLQIMLPYLFFICLVALCMGIFNALHHFTLPALTPVILNIVWIAMLVLICPRFGVTPEERILGVAWGILGAGAIQLLVQLPLLWRLGIRPQVSFAWRDPRVLRILVLMAPVALGMGVHQVNVLVDGVLALAVGTWAPAALTYAERLIYLPLGVFATALGTVLLPTFSTQAARNEPHRIRETLDHSLRHLLLIMTPAAAGLLVLAGPIVQLAFAWRGGRFDAHATLLTARALRFYAPGLVVFSLYKLLVPAFYALKDTRTPVRVGIAMVGLNLALNLLFILTWAPEWRHAGLAFATVCSSAANGLILAGILSRRIGNPGWSGILLTFAKAAGAAGVMALAAGAAVHAAAVLSAGRLPAKFVQALSVSAGIAIGIAVYTLLVSRLCRTEWQDLKSALRHRREQRNTAGTPGRRP